MIILITKNMNQIQEQRRLNLMASKTQVTNKKQQKFKNQLSYHDNSCHAFQEYFAERDNRNTFIYQQFSHSDHSRTICLQIFTLHSVSKHINNKIIKHSKFLRTYKISNIKKQKNSLQFQNIILYSHLHGSITFSSQLQNINGHAPCTRRSNCTQHISAWSCLIRSDFNFILLMFCYFIFVSNRSMAVVNLVLVTVLALIVLDLIFFLFVSGHWLTISVESSVWNSLMGMHRFALFTSAVVFILKIPMLYFIWNHRKLGVGYLPQEQHSISQPAVYFDN